MKYIWICLVLAAIVAVEAWHQLSSEDPVDLVCAAPEARQGARHEALLRQLTGH